MSTKQRIIELESKLDGLKNDAHSPEVLRHLQACAARRGPTERELDRRDARDGFPGH